MTLNKKDIQFAFALIASLFIFYPELFLAKAASLIGDHWEQHYPWAYLLSNSLRHGQIPFWTSFIHCGFPIGAEGQIGIFYIPNLILYLLLPFKWAYSYQNIFHFLVAGFATYFYCRKIKLSPESSFVSAFIFTFGTAYGGAYYNITSLKTIAWLPLCLFLFEAYYSSKQFRYIFTLSIVISQLLVAGYLQVALLLLMVFNLYIVLRIFLFSDSLEVKSRLNVLKGLCLCLLFVVIFSFPQIWLTFELAIKSNRVGLSEDYAYIGSMSPLAISTLVVAIAQGFCRGNSIYGGIFSVILILFGILSKNMRRNKLFKLWIWIAAASLLLALGRWSPLYVFLIKATHFYSFRTPMKFLIFICFSLAVLSGFGFEEAFKKNDLLLNRLVRDVYLGIISFFIFIFFIIYLFLTSLKPYTIRLGEWVIQKFVYGHIGRPHSLDIYYDKLDRFLDAFKSVYTFHYFWASWNVAIIFVSIIFILVLPFTRNKKTWLVFGFIFLFVDLYTFASFDIKKDFGFYSEINHVSPMIEKLTEERNKGSLGRIYGFCKPDNSLPLIPSVNMLYDIEDIGAYSPFILKRYYETIGRFGNVNDSNVSYIPNPEFVYQHLKLLSTLGVTHILSNTPLENRSLKMIFSDSEGYLYEPKGTHQKAFFVNQIEVHSNWQSLKERLMEPNFDPREKLLLEKSEYQKIGIVSGLHKNSDAIIHMTAENSWEIETKGAGAFVLMDTMYPGWFAIMNGKKAPILYAYGVFRAIWINQPGKYEIKFIYRPFNRFFRM